jgi:hypothetical protein
MYLFFIRHFNDVDHISPIVWKMKQDNYPVAVFCLNPEYDIQKDYRLLFLKQLGIKVNFIYDEFSQKLGPEHRVLRLISRGGFAVARLLEDFSPSSYFHIFERFRRRAQEVGKKYYKRCRKKFYDQSWAHFFLEQTNAQALAFDWIRPNWFVVNVLLMAAKDMSIPTLSLPHGVFVYTNNSVSLDLKADEKNFKKFNLYDYVVVQNVLFKETICRSGINKEKIFVLGSARYCNEWMQQNKKIIPRKLVSKGENAKKLKVVFMTTRPTYRIDLQRMLKTFDMLSKLNELYEIEVFIKPHTRSGEEASIYKGLPLRSVSDLSSVELCEWADVMLVIGSSILIETLIQRKPVLYLKYLHENITEYEELGACWTIHDEAELKDALLSLKINKANVPYTEKNINRFLSEIIYGGRGERDVLRDYENFIVSHASNRV